MSRMATSRCRLLRRRKKRTVPSRFSCLCVCGSRMWGLGGGVWGLVLFVPCMRPAARAAAMVGAPRRWRLCVFVCARRGNEAPPTLLSIPIARSTTAPQQISAPSQMVTSAGGRRRKRRAKRSGSIRSSQALLYPEKPRLRTSALRWYMSARRAAHPTVFGGGEGWGGGGM